MWIAGISLAVVVLGGLLGWWLLAPARERERLARERRLRYVVPETNDRVGMAWERASGVAKAQVEIEDHRSGPSDSLTPEAGVPQKPMGRLVVAPEGERIITSPPFVLKESVLGSRMGRYYHALVRRVPAWVVVCPRVRLDGIVTPVHPDGRSAAEWAAWRRRVRLRSVDLLLCDGRNFKPLLAIVFERPTARPHAEIAGGQDRVPDELFREVGLPMLRLSGDFRQDWGLIKPYVDEAILPTVDEDAGEQSSGDELKAGRRDAAHDSGMAVLFDEGDSELQP